MYSIDATSNDKYYIIKLNDKEVCKISKSNSLEQVKRYFGVID